MTEATKPTDKTHNFKRITLSCDGKSLEALISQLSEIQQVLIDARCLRVTSDWDDATELVIAGWEEKTDKEIAFDKERREKQRKVAAERRARAKKTAIEAAEKLLTKEGYQITKKK